MDVDDQTTNRIRNELGPHAKHAAVNTRTSTSDQDGLLSGASELTSNATAHGDPPVTLRAWAIPGSVVVSVDDCGSGIDDPLAGLIPPSREIGTGASASGSPANSATHVAVMNLPDGFRVRIVAGSNIDDPSHQAPTR